LPAGDRGVRASECGDDDDDVDRSIRKDTRRWISGGIEDCGDDHDSDVDHCCSDDCTSGSRNAGGDESSGVCAKAVGGSSDEDGVDGDVGAQFQALTSVDNSRVTATLVEATTEAEGAA
jgi:hypothetical protein